MDKQPTDIHGKTYNRNLLVLVLIIGSFCTVLNGTLLSTALPSIMRSFHISTATAEWLSTAFLLVNGVMIPISAWLINRFGSRKMYLTAMSVFFIGTVIAATAPNFGTLLTGRIIQGLGVGVRCHSFKQLCYLFFLLISVELPWEQLELSLVLHLLSAQLCLDGLLIIFPGTIYLVLSLQLQALLLSLLSF